MRYQSVCVMYYPARQNKEEIEIALFRGDYTDLPDGVKLHCSMTREKLLALFAAALWEVIEPDDGQMIVFARLVHQDGSLNRRLEGKRVIIKQSQVHNLDDMERPAPITVMKKNYQAFNVMSGIDPVAAPPEPYATLATYYPHCYQVSVWHSERVTFDQELMLVTDYGWWEVFTSHVWTTSQTPPDDR